MIAVLPWLGRALATIHRWNTSQGTKISKDARVIRDPDLGPLVFSHLQTLLYQARADLRMETGQLSTV
jgi:hypothetical protein